MDRLLSVRLVPFTARSAEQEQGLAVYARVWPERDLDEARESFERYAGYDDFHGLLAMCDGNAVGVGYGARSYPGVWWHDQVTPILGEDHPALQDAWRLVELAVVTEYRGQGIGGRLHDALLAAHTCSRALLCTGVTNHRARAMYERRGWYYVSPSFDFPGVTQQYTIMGLEK
jgi:ribosomal protein S18 acetylase RimI-like enzyme